FASVPREYIIARELEPTIRKQVWTKIGDLTDKAERGEISTEEELTRQTDAAFEEGQGRLQEYYASYENAVRQRAGTAQMLSRISPASLFEYASEEIAGTGLQREQRFLSDVRAYSRVYDSYVLEKTGKLVGSSMWAFGMLTDLFGKRVYIHSPRAEEYKGDKSDFPHFAESPHSVGDGIRAALPDFVGLLIWNIILALLAAVSIRRTDVR
ncbi:MAG TPA: DUF3526 domain-containing protein, partial [Bacteroidota bacterium]|nr:DUF3526 domain-containing protein [Bacteroidota bacterium]